MRESFATKVYVVGEVLISIIVLIGGGALVYYSGAVEARTVGVSAISAALVFWFQRRAAEQSSNQLAGIADGKLQRLHDRLDAIERSVGGTPHSLEGQ